MSKKPKTPVDFYFPIKKPPLFCRNDVPTNLNNATVMSMMLKNCFYGVADLQSGRSCIFRRDHHCRGSSLTLHSSYFYMKLFFFKVMSGNNNWSISYDKHKLDQGLTIFKAFSITYCMGYPRAVPFLRNEVPFSLLKILKPHTV